MLAIEEAETLLAHCDADDAVVADAAPSRQNPYDSPPSLGIPLVEQSGEHDQQEDTPASSTPFVAVKVGVSVCISTMHGSSPNS